MTSDEMTEEMKARFYAAAKADHFVQRVEMKAFLKMTDEEIEEVLDRKYPL